MIQTIIILLLTILLIVFFIRLLVLFTLLLIGYMKNKVNQKYITRVKKTSILFAITLLLNIAFIAISQFTVSTPGIYDENGNIVENSISELEKIDLNGRKEWISIRGNDVDKPILLFLAGGPGGSQMAAVRYELSELEKHFIVVNWDQAGSGKSYYAEEIDKITVETYISDAHALTNYLMQRFGKEKIYLVGESWGSALGIFLIDRYPDNYYAFIGTGQMIDFAQTEQMDYTKALEIAKERNDPAIIEKLKSNGVPPYYGKDVTWKSSVYLNYLSELMINNPDISNSGYETIRDVFSQEYGFLDKINYFRGIINTFNNVYQQLYQIDLRSDFNKLKVPVYFFEGRHDLNAPTSLVEEYVSVLDAPIKEIIWFEHSGHSPWINESEKFVEELLKVFQI